MVTRSEIKYIQSLSDKKFRNEAGVFVAEGPKIVNELLLEKRVELVNLYATSKWQSIPGIHAKEVSDQELKSMSFLTTPNQVLGVFKQLPLPETYEFAGKLTLLLDGIQDPGNLGTIIRIADWFAVEAIVTANDSADAYNPKVVQATMGSIARVQVIPVQLDAFLFDQKDIPVYASALNGVPLHQLEKPAKGLLAIGNESRGLSERLLAHASQRITIPRLGMAESLNAAVATGILLSNLTTI